MGVRHSLGLLCLAALAALLGLVAGAGDTLEGLSAGFYLLALVLTALGLWRLYRYLTAD